MSIDNVSFVRTNISNNNTNAVRIIAEDSKTGSELGHIYAEEARNTSYNMPLVRSYYDELNSTTFRKVAVPHMHIEDLRVNENVRNQGIGRKLVALIVKESYDRNLNGKVVVTAGNIIEKSPLPFYRRLGFVVNNKYLMNRLDYAAKYKNPFDRAIQAVMTISHDAGKRLLKFIR